MRPKRSGFHAEAAWWVAALLVAGAAGAAGDGSAPPARLAYVDPGSGSFILQALVAMAAGAAVAINAYWRKIKQLLGLGTPPADDESADPQNRDD